MIEINMEIWFKIELNIFYTSQVERAANFSSQKLENKLIDA